MSPQCPPSYYRTSHYGCTREPIDTGRQCSLRYGQMSTPGASVLTLLKNLQNKELSDDTDGILSMQGVSWINRTAISYGTITLYIKHYKDENGIEHVVSEETLTGIPGSTEKRTLDWAVREHSDYVFGALVGKARRRKVEDIEDDFLRGGWLPDTVEHGVIALWTESDTAKSGYSWTSDEVSCVSALVSRLG